MTKQTIQKYTLAQHSGFAYKGNPIFAQAVELTGLTTAQDVALVAKVGGLIFNTYEDAYKAEEAANYPAGVEGIAPQAKGGFAKEKIDGKAIYLPNAKTRA